MTEPGEGQWCIERHYRNEDKKLVKCFMDVRDSKWEANHYADQVRLEYPDNSVTVTYVG